jgi:DNA-binding NtrC family response regulator
MAVGHATTPASGGAVLIIDDDLLLCELQRRWLEGEGFSVDVRHDGREGLDALTASLPDVVCLDLMMPEMDGFETLDRISARHPLLPVIVMTAQTGAESAVRAMKAGAYDYLVKPVEQTKFLAEVSHAVERSRLSLRVAQLEREVAGRGYPGIVGESPAIKQLFRRLDRIAARDITVMIHGESGTGKELVARALHEQSSRSKGPFVGLSCAAIPESLQESELFGHERGAFTGATARRAGCFERSHNGTLFLDEIGELSTSLQAKLLRVLQERSFMRVGGSVEVRSDFRLIVATHRDLAAEVEAGRFREDLFYRIAVMDVAIPPLRERRSDIPLLARHFLDLARDKNAPTLQLAPNALETLLAHDWPGNVRELQNAIERAAVEADGKTIEPRHLPGRIRGGTSRLTASSVRGGAPAVTAEPTDDRDVPAADQQRHGGARTLEEIERDAIAAALARTNGNVAQVVRELGIGRTTLYRKIKKFGLR